MRTPPAPDSYIRELLAQIESLTAEKEAAERERDKFYKERNQYAEDLYELRRVSYRLGQRLIGDSFDEDDEELVRIGKELTAESNTCPHCYRDGQDGDPDGGTYACSTCGGTGRYTNERLTIGALQAMQTEEYEKRQAIEQKLRGAESSLAQAREELAMSREGFRMMDAMRAEAVEGKGAAEQREKKLVAIIEDAPHSEDCNGMTSARRATAGSKPPSLRRRRRGLMTRLEELKLSTLRGKYPDSWSIQDFFDFAVRADQVGLYAQSEEYLTIAALMERASKEEV